MAEGKMWDRLEDHGERLASVEATVDGLKDELTKIDARIGGSNKRLDTLIFLALTGRGGLVIQFMGGL